MQGLGCYTSGWHTEQIKLTHAFNQLQGHIYRPCLLRRASAISHSHACKNGLKEYARGDHSQHDWLRTRVHKSVEKGGFFDIRHHQRLMQKGYIFRC